jgi:hypothetical protein
VDRPIDSWKKYPLFFLGDWPFPVALGARAPALHLGERSQWENSFICLSASASTIHAYLTELESAGCDKDQIIIFLNDRFPIPKKYLVLEFYPNEFMEDLRSRLFAKLESLRLRRLASELERAQKLTLLQDLSREESVRALEQARVAHALAYAYQLPPQKHSLAIQLAFGAGFESAWSLVCSQASGSEKWHEIDWQSKKPWAADLPIEVLIALCARVALECRDNAAHFREVFRQQSSLLPFGSRNELKEQAEKILELLWGGKTNVA